MSVAQDRHFSVVSSRAGSRSGSHNADPPPQLGHLNSFEEPCAISLAGNNVKPRRNQQARCTLAISPAIRLLSNVSVTLRHSAIYVELETVGA
jgi:hypothetical protein